MHAIVHMHVYTCVCVCVCVYECFCVFTYVAIPVGAPIREDVCSLSEIPQLDQLPESLDAYKEAMSICQDVLGTDGSGALSVF